MYDNELSPNNGWVENFTNFKTETTMNIQTKNTNKRVGEILRSAFSLFATFLFFLIFSSQLYASNITGEDGFSALADTSKVYNTVDEMPQLIGGFEELYKNIKYPEKALASQIEGQVFIRFVLDREGNVTQPEVVRDIGGGCGQAAIDAVKKVKFIPGKHGGEVVKVQYTLPVRFQLLD